VIAHVDFPKIRRVGKYGVDVGAIDEAADRLTVDRDADLFLVNEIGKMECLSDRFVIAMRLVLAEPRPVVATIVTIHDLPHARPLWSHPSIAPKHGQTRETSLI
jgi:nucleoside-triphosphatase THEP1